MGGEAPGVAADGTATDATDATQADGRSAGPGPDGTGGGSEQQGGTQPVTGLPASPVYWQPGGERHAYLLLNGPDGLSVTGSEHGVGLYRDKPPVVAAGQTLVRVTLPAGTSVIDVAATLREANGQPGPVVRQAVADGHALLLPRSALDQVRVDKVYQPGSGWAGGPSWLGGAAWRPVTEQTRWSWFTGTGQTWRPSSGKSLADLYRPWTTDLGADPRAAAALRKFTDLSPKAPVTHGYALLGGPDGAGLVGGPHAVGLFRHMPPAVASGQTLVRVVMPEGTAVNLPETLRRRPQDVAVPEVKQALNDGHDLLLPRWLMDGVRVDKIYETRPGGAYANGLAWQESAETSGRPDPMWRPVSELHRPRATTTPGTTSPTATTASKSTVDTTKVPGLAQQQTATAGASLPTPPRSSTPGSTTSASTTSGGTTPTPVVTPANAAQVAPSMAPRQILSGAYLPGPPDMPNDIPGAALRSHLGYFTVAAHFDGPTGRVIWGDRSLTAREFADLVPTLPGWAEAVAEAGGTPRVIVVACGVAAIPAGGQAYLAEVAALTGIDLLGATGDAVQQPGGDIVVEPGTDGRAAADPAGPRPEWLLHHGDGRPPTRLGPDLTSAVGELAGNVPGIAVTPAQDGLTAPYHWANDQQVTTPGGHTLTRVDANTYEVVLPGRDQGDQRTPRILVTVGDILQQPTQAIVNAANVNLAHGSGIAGTIANAGGRNAQNRRNIDVSSAQALQNRGLTQLNVGDAVTTPSHDIATRGQQTITHVIHTVGPNYNRAEQQQPQLLYDAVYSALREADANNLTSVAIPQISTDIFHMPVEEATAYTARALLDTRTQVQEVRLVLYGKSEAYALNFADLLFEGATELSPRGPSPHVTQEGITAGRKPKLKAVTRGNGRPARTSTSQSTSRPSATGRQLTSRLTMGRQKADRYRFSRGRLQDRMDHHQVEPVTVPGDNNCFYHSIIEVAGPHITRHIPRMQGLVGPRRLQGVQVLRNWLADRLAADFEVANRGLPSRYASHFRFREDRSIVAQQQEFVRQIRQMGSWDNEAGDSVAYFAANELGLPMLLIQDTHDTPVGPPGNARIPFIRIPNHYMGARYTAGDPGVPWDTLRPRQQSTVDEAELVHATLVAEQQDGYDAARARIDTVLPQLPPSLRGEFTTLADTTATRFQLGLDAGLYQDMPGYRRLQGQLDDLTGARFDLERLADRAERRLLELTTALEVLRLLLDPDAAVGNQVTGLLNQDFGGVDPDAVTAVQEAGGQLTGALQEAAALFPEGIAPDLTPSGFIGQQAETVSEAARLVGSALARFNEALPGVGGTPLALGDLLGHDLNSIAALAHQRDEDLARALQDEAEGTVRWTPIQQQLGPLPLDDGNFQTLDTQQDQTPAPEALAWEQLAGDWEALAAQFDTVTRRDLQSGIGTVPDGPARAELTRDLAALDRAYGDALQTVTNAQALTAGDRVPNATTRDQIRARLGAVHDRIAQLQHRIDAARTQVVSPEPTTSGRRGGRKLVTTVIPSIRRRAGTNGSRRPDRPESSKPPLTADKPLDRGQLEPVTRGVPSERAWEQLTRTWNDLSQSYTEAVDELGDTVDGLTSTALKGPLQKRITALRTDHDGLAELMARATEATTGEQVPNAQVRSHLAERITAFRSRFDDVRSRVEAAAEAAKAAGQQQDQEIEARQDDDKSDGRSTLAKRADRADRTRIFAPPSYTTRGDLRQALGPHTAEPVDEVLVDQLRKLVLDRFPDDMYDEVSGLLDDKLTDDTLAKDMEQVVGEELSLFLKTSKGTYLVTLTLHLGDWTQLTDPRGNLLNTAFADYYHLPGREVRTRQMHESTLSVGSSRTVSTEFGISSGVDVGKGFHDGEGFNSVKGTLLKTTLPVHKASRTHASGTTATTTRYVKGSSYRAVDFLHDVGAIVTVQKAGEGIQVGHAVVEDSLVMRYSRETLRHADRPDRDTTYATSELWKDLTGEEDATTAEIQETYEIVDGDPNARDSAQHRTLLPKEPMPTDTQLGEAHELPRTSWIEALGGSSQVRAAIFNTVDSALTTPGTMSHQSLTTFASVGNLKGGLHQAAKGGLIANPVSERNTFGVLEDDSVRVTVSLHQGQVLVEEDPFSRVDTEDTYVSSTSQPITKADNLNTSQSATAAFGKLVTGAPTLPLSLERSVSQSQPGIGAGSVILHKLKFTGEPQSLVGYTTVYTVQSLTDPTRVERVKGYTVVRMLKADALRDERLRDQFSDQEQEQQPSRPASQLSVSTHGTDLSMTEQEQAAAAEAARRRSPDRMLVMPPQFTDWLPPFSRISRWGPEAVRVLDRTVELVVQQFPEFLPGIEVLADEPVGGGSRVRFGPGWTAGFDNFLTLWNALNPEKLAGRTHKMAGGGEEILLTLPGNLADQHLTVRLAASYDRTDFRYQRSLNGQVEVYYGNFWDLVTSTSRGWSVSTGLDVPLGFSKATSGLLKEFDVKFAPRVSWSGGTTDRSGYGAGGSIGGGSDWMAEFRGHFTFHVSAEKVTVNRPKDQMPGSYPGTPGYTGEGGDLEAGVTVTKQLATVEPFRVSADLLVSEDLSREVELPETETRTLAEIGTAELYTLPNRPTLDGAEIDQDWTPDPESGTAVARLPQDALLTPNTAPLLATVQSAFTQLGVATLAPTEHTELATRLYTAGPQFRDYLKRPRQVWRTRLKWGPFRDTMAEVRLKATITKMSAIGSSDHAYRYLHSLGSSTVGTSRSSDPFNKSVSTEVGFPLKFDPDAVNQLGTSGSVRYGRNNPVTDSVTDFGGFDRVEIDIGHQVWAGVDVTWTAQVLVWDAGVGAHGGPQVRTDTTTGGGTNPTAGRGQPPTPTGTTRSASEDVEVAGLALIPYKQAADRNLIVGQPEVLGKQSASAVPGASASQAWTVLSTSTRQPTSDASGAPDDTGTILPGALLPPSNTLRGDGIGHAVKMETPELDQTPANPGFHQAAMELVREAFPPEIADAIEVQLEKITSQKATDALLEDMLTGLSVLVPDRGGLTASIATMTIKATLQNPRHEGPSHALKVLERKNARGHQRDAGGATSGSWTVSGGASQSHGFGGVGTLQEQGTGLSISGSRSTERGLSAGVKHEESFGLLSILRPEQFRFDVHLDFTVELDTALIAELGLTTGDVFRWHESASMSGVVHNGLLLGYPKQISQPDPRAVYPLTIEAAESTGSNHDDSDSQASDRASIVEIDEDAEHIALEELDKQGRAKSGEIVGTSVAAAAGAQSGTDPLRPERPEHRPTRTTLPPGEHHSRLRRGLPLTSTLLSEIDIETVGGIPQLRKVAKSLFDRPGIRSKLFGDETSWQTGKHRLHNKIDVTLTNSFLVRNGIAMLDGDGFHESLTDPGMVYDSDVTFEVSADVLEWGPVDYDASTGVTLTNTITKDFERRQSVSSTTHKSAHGIGASVTPLSLRFSDNIDELPTKPDTGGPDTTTMRSESLSLSLNPSVRFESSTTATSPAAQLEKGDKTTGRDYTRMTATQVRWNFSWRSSDDDTAQVVSVVVSDEAMVLWAPTGRVPDLLDLVPVSETAQAEAEGNDVPPRNKPEVFDTSTDPGTLDVAALRSDIAGLRTQVDVWTSGNQARTERQHTVAAMLDAATKAGRDVTAIRGQLADARAAFIHQSRLLHGLQLPDDQRLATLSGQQLRALRTVLQDWLAASDQLSDAIEAAERALGETAAPPGMADPVGALRDELASLTDAAPRRDADLRRLYRIIDGAAAAGITVDGINEALEAAEEEVAATQGAGRTAADVTAQMADLTVPLAFQHQSPLQAYVDSLRQLDTVMQTQSALLHQLLVANAGALRDQVHGFDDAIQQDADGSNTLAGQQTLLQDWLDAAEDADIEVAALSQRLDTAIDEVRQAREAMYWPDGVGTVDNLTPEQLALVYPGMRDLTAALQRRDDVMAEVQEQLEQDAADHRPPTLQESASVRRDLSELRTEETRFNEAARNIHTETEQDLRDWLAAAEDNDIDVADQRQRLDDTSRAMRNADNAIPRFDGLTPETYTPRQTLLQRDGLRRFFEAVADWQRAMDATKAWLTTNAPGHAPVSTAEQRAQQRDQLKQRLHTVRSTAVKSTALDAREARLRRVLTSTANDQIREQTPELRTRMDTSSRAVTDLLAVVAEFTRDSVETFDSRRLAELTGTLDELQQALTDRADELTGIEDQLTDADAGLQEPDPAELQQLRDQLAGLQTEGQELRDRYERTLATVQRLHQWLDSAEAQGLDVAGSRDALTAASQQLTNADDNLPDLEGRTEPDDFPLVELRQLIPLLADLMATWRTWYDTVADVEQRLTRTAPHLAPVAGMTVPQVRREIRDIHRSLTVAAGDDARNQRRRHLTDLRTRAEERGIDLAEIDERLHQADETHTDARAAFRTANLHTSNPDTFTDDQARDALPRYRAMRDAVRGLEQEILQAVSEITQLLDTTPPPLPTRPQGPIPDTTPPSELFQIAPNVTAGLATELRNLTAPIGFLLTERNIDALIDHRVAVATGGEVSRLAGRLRLAIEAVRTLDGNIQNDNQARAAIQASQHLQRRLQRFNQALGDADVDPLAPRRDDGSPSLPSDLLPASRPPVTPGRAWQLLHYLREPGTWHTIVREAGTATSSWQLNPPSPQAQQAITAARDALLHGIDQSILDLPDLVPPSQATTGQQQRLVRHAAQLLLLMSTFNQSIADLHAHRPPGGVPQSVSIGVTVVHHTRGGPRPRLGRTPYAEAPIPGTLTDLAITTFTDFRDNWAAHRTQFTTAFAGLSEPTSTAPVTAEQLQSAWNEVADLMDGVEIPDDVPDPDHGTRLTDYAERVRRAFHRYQILLELAVPAPDDTTPIEDPNQGNNNNDGGGNGDRRDSTGSDSNISLFFRPTDSDQQQQQDQQTEEHTPKPPNEKTEQDQQTEEPPPPPINEDATQGKDQEQAEEEETVPPPDEATTTTLRDWDEIQRGHEAVLARMENALNTAVGGTLPRRVADGLEQYTTAYNDLSERIDQLARRVRAGNASPADQNQLRDWVAQLRGALEELERLLVTSTVQTGTGNPRNIEDVLRDIQ